LQTKGYFVFQIDVLLCRVKIKDMGIVKRYITLAGLLGTLLSACVAPSEQTPFTPQATESGSPPAGWTATMHPATATPIELATVVSPSPTPTVLFDETELQCSPAGDLIELGAIETPSTAFDVAVAGEYAYVTSRDGLWVIDVSEPTCPTHVGTTPIQESIPIIALEGFAYGLDANGIWVLDLADPTAPELLAYKELPDVSPELEISQHIAFIRDTHGILRLIDLSEPDNLREVGLYDPPGEIFSGEIYGNVISTIRTLARENSLRSFSILGDYAFVADLDAGLRMVDIQEPSNPSELGSYEGSSRISDVGVIHDYAFIFGIHEGPTIMTWDLWVGNTSDLITGLEPHYLGTVSIPQGSKSELLCTFLSDAYGLILASEFEGALKEIQPVEIAGLLAGVEVVEDHIFVAEEGRGLLILQLAPGTN
jgi:hypothetical protein